MFVLGGNFLSLWRCAPLWAGASSLSRLYKHTQRHTTVQFGEQIWQILLLKSMSMTLHTDTCFSVSSIIANTWTFNFIVPIWHGIFV